MITPENFDFVQALIKERSGINLTRDKGYLIENRFQPLAKRHGFAGPNELIAALRANRNGDLARAATEAMTTNESLFFRDTKPFDLMRSTVLPELLQRRGGGHRIRIWCAACSSGQEPYSLAMLLAEEQAKLKDTRVEIVATDISSEILARAKEGVYSHFEVQRGLPIKMLVKNFKQTGNQWTLNSDIRAMVDIRRHNILDDAAGHGRFDVVFCRNLLIYFDPDTKRQALGRIRAVLAPDGFLFIGATETVMGVVDGYEPLGGCQGAYRRADGRSSAATAPQTAAAAR